MLRWSLYVVLVVAVAHSARGLSLRTMCLGHSYGTLLPNPRDCNSYYVCQSGPQLAYCDHGLHFDRVNRVCNWPQMAHCRLDEMESDILLESDKKTDEQSPGKSGEVIIGESVENGAVNDGQGSELAHEEVEISLHEIPNTQDSSQVVPVEILNPESNTAQLSNTQEISESDSAQLSNTQEVNESDSAQLSNAQEASESNSSSQDSPQILPVPVVVPSEVPSAQEISESDSAQLSNAQEINESDSAELLSTQEAFESNSSSQDTPQLLPVPVMVAAEISSASESDSAHLFNALEVSESDSAELFHAQEASESNSSPQDTPQLLPVPVVVPAEVPSAHEISETDSAQLSNVQESPESTELLQVEASEIPGAQVAVAKPIPDSVQVSVGIASVDNPKPSKDPGMVVQIPVAVATVTKEEENAQEDSAHSPSEDTSQSVVEDVEALQVVESLKPPQGSGQVIELMVPAQPVQASNSSVSESVDLPEGDAIVEKVESPKDTQGSGQVIELPVLAQPVQAPSSPVSESISLPEGEVVVEKVESAQATQGFGQVIELSVPALPAQLPSSSVSESIGLPQGEVVVEKVESSKDSQATGQVIELSVPAQPIQAPSSPMSESIGLPQGDVIVEKVESAQPSQGSSQVIELSVPALPNFNANVPHATESMDSSEPINLPVPARPSGLPQSHAILQSSFNSADSESGSSESGEDLIPKSAESSEENTNHLTDSQSSEEAQPLKQTSSSEETDGEKVFFQSAQSSEEVLNQAQAAQQASEESQSVEKTKSSEEDFFEGAAHKVESSTSSEKVHTQSNHVRPIFQSNTEKVVTPEPENIPEPQAESHNVNSIDPLNTLGPKHTNLIVSVLSVASLQGNNSTIHRPIVGAHNPETGHPIDGMTGYNSRKVQCIHDGLYFLPHPSNCQKYFICAYRHLHMHSCGSNLTWSYQRDQCELEHDARCYANRSTAKPQQQPQPEPLPEPEKTSKPPARDDNVEKPLPETTAAPISSTPMPPLRTTQAPEVSPSQSSKIPICPPLRQVHLPSFSDCNKYYICILGEPVLTSCPENLHWDARGEFCGQPSEVRCVSR